MKQKDLALIGVIIFISAIMSLVISKLVFATPDARQQQVEVVAPITDKFDQPSKAYFNDKALDPTKFISIKDYSTGTTTPTVDFSAGQ